MRFVLLFALVFALLVAFAPTGLAMSVNEAYRTIPHRQTTFDKSRAKMGGKEKAYLNTLFNLVDKAMTQRVGMLLWFQSDGKRGTAYETYSAETDKIVASLKQLAPPFRLRGVHALVTDAIVEQSLYFKQWHENPQAIKRFNPRNRQVQRSHENLLKAYNTLMQFYPRDSQHTHQAFYDHLCALDFI